MSGIADFLKLKPGVWALLVCLFLLPFISWLYIRKGVDFRVNALDELKNKVEVPVFNSLLGSDKPFTTDSLAGRVGLFIKVNDAIEPDYLKAILHQVYEQNEGSIAVRIFLCGKATLADELKLDSVLVMRQFVQFAPDSIFELLEMAYEKEYKASSINPNALIVDNQKKIRYMYDLSYSEDVKKLIQHSGVLIPEYKKQRPELIRQEAF